MKIGTVLKFLMATGLLALAGCGGGSSSSSAPVTYDLNHLITQAVNTKQNYNLKATSGGNTYSLHLSSTPGPSEAFNGVMAHTNVQTLEAFENGTLITNDTGTGFYELDPYRDIGFYNATTGYVTVDVSHVMPSSASIGDSGAFETSTVYYDTSLTSVFGHQTETWSLEAGSGSDATFCVDITDESASGNSTETDCYTIDPAGNALGLTITLSVNGVTLTFQ